MDPSCTVEGEGTIEVRFYGELNDFLPLERRQRSFAYHPTSSASAKHVIEALGVPHTEVGLVLVNGEPVDLSHRVHEGDRISVYPTFRSIDVLVPRYTGASPTRDARFVVDTHLGKLAAYLRMLGFDTLYWNDCDDDTLARIASAEHRILLTRDRGLLMRRQVERGFYVRDDDPDQQIFDVLRRFDLFGAIAPFTRCFRCNSPLEHVAKEAVLDRLLPKTRKYYDEFSICRACDQVYWRGSHWEHMQQLVNRIMGSDTPATR